MADSRNAKRRKVDDTVQQLHTQTSQTEHMETGYTVCTQTPANWTDSGTVQPQHGHLKDAAPVFDTLDQNPNVLSTRREVNHSNSKIQVPQIVHDRLPTTQQTGDMISRGGAGVGQRLRQKLVAPDSDTLVYCMYLCMLCVSSRLPRPISLPGRTVSSPSNSPGEASSQVYPINYNRLS